MLFRPVRGGLATAMAEVQEINTLSDLLQIVAKDCPNGIINSLELEHQGWDHRIGWDSHLVVVNGQAAGYTNGNFS